MRSVAFVSALSACLMLPAAGYAQSSDYSTLTSPESAQNWHLRLGAGLRYQPDYMGSNDFIFSARPIISLGRGVKSTWWAAEDDAISIGVFTGQGWRVGFSGDLLWKRSSGTNRALYGIPEAKFGAEAGAFVEFYPTSWLRARADLRRGFFAHDALVADFKLDAFTRVGPWSLGVGPRMRIVGADYVRTYFGTYGGWPGSGGFLQRYNAGLHSVGAIAQATYNWTEKFETTAYVEFKHLTGDAAKSPIVKTYGSRNSITLGISASYAFDLGF